MTYTSRALGALAIAMLLLVSGVALVHADTNYNEPVSTETTNTMSAGGAGDMTEPGIPNTGLVDTTPWGTVFFVIVAVAAIAGVGYFLFAPRRAYNDL